MFYCKSESLGSCEPLKLEQIDDGFIEDFFTINVSEVQMSSTLTPRPPTSQLPSNFTRFCWIHFSLHNYSRLKINHSYIDPSPLFYPDVQSKLQLCFLTCSQTIPSAMPVTTPYVAIASGHHSTHFFITVEISIYFSHIKLIVGLNVIVVSASILFWSVSFSAVQILFCCTQ